MSDESYYSNDEQEQEHDNPGNILIRYKASYDKDYVRKAVLANPNLKNQTLLDYVGFTKPPCQFCKEITDLFYAYHACMCPHCTTKLHSKKFEFIDVYFDEYLEKYTFSNNGCKTCLNQALAEFEDNTAVDTQSRDIDYARMQKNKRSHAKTSCKTKQKTISRGKKYRDFTVV